MIVGGPELQRDEWKRGRQKEANVMVVEALSRHPINFKLEVDNKVSSPHSDPLVNLAWMNRFIIN